MGRIREKLQDIKNNVESDEIANKLIESSRNIDRLFQQAVALKTNLQGLKIQASRFGVDADDMGEINAVISKYDERFKELN